MQRCSELMTLWATGFVIGTIDKVVENVGAWQVQVNEDALN